MRLIDLPITLREAAVKNQIAQGNERDVYRSIFDGEKQGNFNWISSKEGDEFWYSIYRGLFSETLKYRL
jgi:hypothetical protein